jgi:hypothetical protein
MKWSAQPLRFVIWDWAGNQAKVHDYWTWFQTIAGWKECWAKHAECCTYNPP